MELRHLRYFVAVAEALHFGRAAAKLGVAQPPLSRQIRDLEEELGALLFDRESRGVSLTPAGKVLLKEAREVLARAAYAVEATRRAAKGAPRELRVGYLSGPGAVVIPAAMAVFRQSHPGLTVTAIELASSAVAGALERGELDAAFVSEPDANGPLGALRYEPVVKYPLRVGLPAKHPLTRKARVAWRDLRAEKFLVYSPAVAPNYRAWVVALCRSQGFDPDIAAEVVSPTAMLTGIGSGDRVALLLPPYASWAPASVKLRPLTPETEPEGFGLVVAARAPKALVTPWLAALRQSATADGAA